MSNSENCNCANTEKVNPFNADPVKALHFAMLV